MNKTEGREWRAGAIGRRFGRLVVEQAEKRSGKWSLHCMCDCGRRAWVRVDHVRTGKTTSCGCFNQAQTSAANTTHGDSRSPLYRRYKNIVQRCTYPGAIRWREYGGRGIENRFGSYEAFKAWALTNGYAPELTIDRIDVNGHYGPDNCRWIPASAQQSNTRRTVRVEWGGEVLCAADVARRVGCSPSAVVRRHRRGAPLDQPLPKVRA